MARPRSSTPASDGAGSHEGGGFARSAERCIGEDALDVASVVIQPRTHHRRNVEFSPGAKSNDRMTIWPHDPSTSFHVRHDDVTKIHTDFHRQIDLLEMSLIGVPLVKSLIEHSQA